MALLDRFANLEMRSFGSIFGRYACLRHERRKTNLLEAIYLCTCARSHRTGRDEELVKHGCDFYRVSIQFVTDRGLNESVTLKYKLASTRGGSPSRTVYYNDLEVARLSDMMGLFHAIIFARRICRLSKADQARAPLLGCFDFKDRQGVFSRLTRLLACNRSA